MAVRRKATPVSLTGEQRAQLERLWFYYGNYGAKSTPGNHSFIQRLIENGIDERPLNNSRTPKSQIPTPECEAAVDRILSEPERGRGSESAGGSLLRIVPASGREQKVPAADPELKALLKEMNLRHREIREKEDREDNTPDAA